ncbi:hypothetical protein BOTBODRAFT_67310 [Botryobasidium botryosum FD-172 SS1]|uniref:Uncharacterized protein n=1 Tax=Botryobasidium botryosum (strain FD-172 SS1) TaxID=930990 RepID=A0A067MAL9_BOTB1|nr:hypothetical protein BOTBODRAFT_67310 [Botryobasidium botryosum FD-172 SS1]
MSAVSGVPQLHVHSFSQPEMSLIAAAQNNIYSGAQKVVDVDLASRPRLVRRTVHLQSQENTAAICIIVQSPTLGSIKDHVDNALPEDIHLLAVPWSPLHDVQCRVKETREAELEHSRAQAHLAKLRSHPELEEIKRRVRERVEAEKAARQSRVLAESICVKECRHVEEGTPSTSSSSPSCSTVTAVSASAPAEKQSAALHPPFAPGTVDIERLRKDRDAAVCEWVHEFRRATRVKPAVIHEEPSILAVLLAPELPEECEGDMSVIEEVFAPVEVKQPVAMKGREDDTLARSMSLLLFQAINKPAVSTRTGVETNAEIVPERKSPLHKLAKVFTKLGKGAARDLGRLSSVL